MVNKSIEEKHTWRLSDHQDGEIDVISFLYYLQQVHTSARLVAIKFKGEFHHQEFTLTFQKTCAHSRCIHDPPRQWVTRGMKSRASHRKRSGGQVAFHLLSASVKARYCNFVYLLETPPLLSRSIESRETYVPQRFFHPLTFQLNFHFFSPIWSLDRLNFLINIKIYE